eukprot:7567616-Ditylum_brightwellii.AAC.1
MRILLQLCQKGEKKITTSAADKDKATSAVTNKKDHLNKEIDTIMAKEKYTVTFLNKETISLVEQSISWEEEETITMAKNKISLGRQQIWHGGLQEKHKIHPHLKSISFLQEK